MNGIKGQKENTALLIMNAFDTRRVNEVELWDPESGYCPLPFRNLDVAVPNVNGLVRSGIAGKVFDFYYKSPAPGITEELEKIGASCTDVERIDMTGKDYPFSMSIDPRYKDIIVVGGELDIGWESIYNEVGKTLDRLLSKRTDEKVLTRFHVPLDCTYAFISVVNSRTDRSQNYNQTVLVSDQLRQTEKEGDNSRLHSFLNTFDAYKRLGADPNIQVWIYRSSKAMLKNITEAFR